MLIPSIDLQGGRVVQLVQGERLAIATDDIEGWIRRFERFDRVQLIDLDAAKGEGDNSALVEAICRRLPCRVGGGVRSLARASALLAAGARKVICGSALLRDGQPDLALARTLADALGPDRIIAAVDARGGRVAIHGWRTLLDLTPADAVRALEPFAGEFLFTNVDVEGLMQGIDRTAILAVREATSRHLTAAGGVTTRDEVDWLDSLGIDAVVGMAVYTGRIALDEPMNPPRPGPV
jgi:phosphoribosylformimino-5-aminoimidazole carboxamide ribotide isomerase